MLCIADQTAELIALNFFLWTLMGGRGMLKAKINLKFIILNFHFFHGQRRALQLVSIKKRKIIKFK